MSCRSAGPRDNEMAHDNEMAQFVLAHDNEMAHFVLARDNEMATFDLAEQKLVH